MSNNNKFLDDIAKLTDSAINTATGSLSTFKNQFDENFNQKIDCFLKERNFVTYEEFAVVKEIAQKSHEEIERLKKQISELQNK